jgi:uncharacterized membrane protein YjgN (DUF898 family)
MQGKIVFTGNFWDYFIKSFGLGILCVLTLGIMIPYVIYWQFKYFFTKMTIQFEQPTV